VGIFVGEELVQIEIIVGEFILDQDETLVRTKRPAEFEIDVRVVSREVSEDDLGLFDLAPDVLGDKAR